MIMVRNRSLVTWSILLLASHSATDVVFAAEPSASSGLRVEYRGALSLPEMVADAAGSGVPLTGLSGITWFGDDRYIAVMDNSRFILRLRLELAADGTPRAASDLELVTLAARHDYEDIAPRLGGDDAVYLCEEDTPAIRIFRLVDGAERGEVPLPATFGRRRPNRGPEALALDPDGRHLWTATEEAVATDGPGAAPRVGTVVRLARLPLDPARPARHVAYEVDPPHDVAALLAGAPLSGVVAIVALGRGRLLVLERSAAPGLPPFESRLYLVDTTDAADVARIDRGLSTRRETFVAKKRLWSDALGLNLEGLCLGPKLAADRRALVGIADNGGLGTPTQVTAFELAAVTSP